MRIKWDVMMESRYFVRLSKIVHVSMQDLDELHAAGLEIVKIESSYDRPENGKNGSTLAAITEKPQPLDPAGDLPGWYLLCRKEHPSWKQFLGA